MKNRRAASFLLTFALVALAVGPSRSEAAPFGLARKAPSPVAKEPAEVAPEGTIGPDGVPATMPAPSVEIPDLGADPVGWASRLYEAVRSGSWVLVVGLALIGAIYAVRRWVLASWAWAQTDRGGVAVAGGVALAGALANATLAGEWPDGKTLVAALQVALVAMGGYTGVRKLLWPQPAVTA